MKHTKRKKVKFNSHCEVCKKPAMAPEGNFNAKKITLCRNPKCHRRRKTELQKERRRQQLLALNYDKP